MRHLIIGYGSIGKRHYALLKEKGEETHFLDPGTNLSECNSSIFFTGVVLADWWKDIDMVWICTPTIFHYPYAMEAIKKGKRVFIEKPITATLEQAKEIQKAGGNVWVACNMRFHPAILKLKEALPKVGRVLYSRMHFSHYLPYQRENWQEYIKNTNIIMDAGWHYVDLALWFFGRCKDLYKTKRGIEIYPFNDFAIIDMQMEKSEQCEIHLDYLRRDKSWGIEIIGTEGTLTLENHFKNTEVASVKYRDKREMIELEHRRFHGDEMYENQIDFLLKNPTASNIDETISVMEICS